MPFELLDPFQHAFLATIGREGDYSDDPDDAGGATRFGITEAVARANGYHGPMRDLPYAKAVEIARAQYWDIQRLDDVAKLAPAVAAELFDTGYHAGVATAGAFLQRALNALNHRGADYPDVKVDGVIGPMTLAALRAYLAMRGAEGADVLFKALNCLQGAAYINDVEQRPRDERFVYGWIRARVA